MTFLTFLIAVCALILALVGLARGKEANERADDCMRYLSDLRSRHGTEIKELFQEIYRLKVKIKAVKGEIEDPPYEISDACVGCGTCEEECPEDAIKPGDIYRIDPDLCSACGTCESVCPVDACSQMKIESE